MNNYPRGKLNEHDEGETPMAIYIENNVLMIDFGKPIVWIGLHKKMALLLVDALSKKIEKMIDDH